LILEPFRNGAASQSRIRALLLPELKVLAALIALACTNMI